MKTRVSIIAAVALCAAALCSIASGYGLNGRHPGNKVTMRASAVSFPAGSTWRAALGNVASRYYNNPSAMWFEMSWDDTSVGLYNFQNEAWFSSNLDAPATTFWWTNIFTGDLVEADCVFNVNEAYTTSSSRSLQWAYGGGYRFFEATVAHEFGHAAGLAHEDSEYNIMGQDWTHIHSNGSTVRSYVGEDACDGLVALYGTAGGGFEDLSVTLFKWVGSSGEYSTHDKCGMFSSAGALLPSSSFAGQRRYHVARGQPVRIEFTYENCGESTQAPLAGLYISTNNLISTADRLIGTYSFSLSRGDVYTAQIGATIPADLVAGQTYYLGILMNHTNAIAEVDGENNAAYHVILVQ